MTVTIKTWEYMRLYLLPCRMTTLKFRAMAHGRQLGIIAFEWSFFHCKINFRRFFEIKEDYPSGIYWETGAIQVPKYFSNLQHTPYIHQSFSQLQISSGRSPGYAGNLREAVNPSPKWIPTNRLFSFSLERRETYHCSQR